jgi:hypothetical protein
VVTLWKLAYKKKQAQQFYYAAEGLSIIEKVGGVS